MTVELLNVDCMEYMRGQPAEAFDLAVVDPPYLDAALNTPDGHMRGNDISSMKDWQDAPKEKYFNELRRVSKEAIIFGGTTLLNTFSQIIIGSSGTKTTMERTFRWPRWRGVALERTPRFLNCDQWG